MDAANVGLRNVHLLLLMDCFKLICDLAIHLLVIYLQLWSSFLKLINSSSTKQMTIQYYPLNDLNAFPMKQLQKNLPSSHLKTPLGIPNSTVV